AAVERVRHEPALIHRQRARRDDRPDLLTARAVVRVERAVAMPGPLHARLAPGMAELDCRHRALGLQELGNAAQWRDLRIFPEAEIAMGDPPLAAHRCGLDEDEPGAAQREAREM